MLPSIVTQWKMYLVSLAALAASITATPSLTQLVNPQAAYIPANSGTSRNWAGYATSTGQFTSVSGTWTIPSVTRSTHTSADATWVGIGGITSADLIQSGTQNIISHSGQVTTAAFYELLPDVSQTIPVTVSQGDSVTVTLTQTSPNQWQIAFKDNTNGNTYSTTASYSSSLSSAEWIEEAPSTGRGILPLDNFGSISFTNGSTTQNGSPVTLTQSNVHPITMINGQGQTLATPSSLTSDGTSFSVTRSANQANTSQSAYDQNPFGWRRHGMGVGSYSPFPGSQYDAATPTGTQIPQGNSSSSSTIPQRRFRIRMLRIPRFFRQF